MTAEQRPEIPEGFTWRELPRIKGGLVVPSKWYSKEEEMSPGLTGYFFSQEPIAGDGVTVIPTRGAADGIILGDTSSLFKTGFSMYCQKLANRIFHRAPSELAKMYILKQENMDPKGEATILQDGKILICRRPFSISSIFLNGVQLPPVRLYVMAAGNDLTGTFYTASFETPAKNWKENKDMAKAIIESVKLSPEI